MVNTFGMKSCCEATVAHSDLPCSTACYMVHTMRPVKRSFGFVDFDLNDV